MSNLSIEPLHGSIYLPASHFFLKRVHRDLKASISSRWEQTYQWNVCLDPFCPSTQHNGKLSHRLFTITILFYYRDKDSLHKLQHDKHTISHLIYRKRTCTFTRNSKNNTRIKNCECNTNSNTICNNFDIATEVYLKQLLRQNSLELKFSGPYIIQRKFRNEIT